MRLQSALIFAVVGIVAVAAAYCVTGCKPPLAQQAEMTYGAELQACTATAKVRHPHDNDAGRADSEACERDVDARWGAMAAITDAASQ